MLKYVLESRNGKNKASKTFSKFKNGVAKQIKMLSEGT
jgi:hypothetical protein